MFITAHDVTDVTLRPVALLADHLRRPRIRRRDMNGPVEIATDYMIKLPRAVQLRFEKGGCARADVTIHAFDVGVDAVLRRHEFRFHRNVATLSTKFDRLCVMIGLVTAEGG